MVGNEDAPSEKKKTSLTNDAVKSVISTIENLENITVLDISNRNIRSLSEELQLPQNIVHLNASKNSFTEVPTTVLNLKNLKTLDLSFNSIVFFDDPPASCHTIERLDLSYNDLQGPPLWVWVEKPKKLHQLNISNNKKLCYTLTNRYFEELLQYTTLVNEIDVHNCKLDQHVKLLATFCHAKVISLGSVNYECISFNNLDHVPCKGLEECCDIEVLNLCNTQIYTINCNIDIYKHLKEIDLSQNNINSLPNEFCNLESLQSCILSFNKLFYLPDNVNKLSKLHILCLDNNELCMLPQTLNDMPCLKKLDLYNNHLYEYLCVNNLEELDFAQNYFDEPSDEKYTLSKERLRLNCFDRLDGRKSEVFRDESERSRDETDDDELYALIERGCPETVTPNSRSSTPEDWDSDEYWIPQYYKPVTPPRSPWLYFVKKKMDEGNFCPMDAHPVSIVEQVKYEKLCNPQIELEIAGQFDDYSDDDS